MAMSYPADASWRDSARAVRFFFFDYRACVPLLALLFFPSQDALIMAILAMFFFSIIERYGFTVVVFTRVVLSFLGGSLKLSRPWWQTPKWN